MKSLWGWTRVKVVDIFDGKEWKRKVIFFYVDKPNEIFDGRKIGR